MCLGSDDKIRESHYTNARELVRVLKWYLVCMWIVEEFLIKLFLFFIFLFIFFMDFKEIYQ